MGRQGARARAGIRRDGDRGARAEQYGGRSLADRTCRDRKRPPRPQSRGRPRRRPAGACRARIHQPRHDRRRATSLRGWASNTWMPGSPTATSGIWTPGRATCKPGVASHSAISAVSTKPWMSRSRAGLPRGLTGLGDTGSGRRRTDSGAARRGRLRLSRAGDVPRDGHGRVAANRTGGMRRGGGRVAAGIDRLHPGPHGCRVGTGRCPRRPLGSR